jgi:hypothetical protein
VLLLCISYLQDLSAKPPPGSCRAGAVVHLQHANNSKVPVTLQLSQHDDGEHMQHVIKVRRLQLFFDCTAFVQQCVMILLLL